MAAVTETIRRHAAEWVGAESVPDLYAAMSRMGADVALRAVVDGGTPAGRRIAEILTRYKLSTTRHAPHARSDRAERHCRDYAVVAGGQCNVDVVAHPRCPGSGPIAHPDQQRRAQWLSRSFPSSRIVSWVNHLFGAYNAVDYTVTMAFVLLERYRDVRRAIEAELQGAATHQPSPDLFAGLPILHNFAREVFRMTPVANVVLREVAVPLTVNGATLLPGTQCPRHSGSSPRRPALGGAAALRPLSLANGAIPHAPFAYIPFLTGPRQCWGRPLAEMVFVLTLRELLGRCSVRVLTPDAQPTAYMMPRFTAPMRAQVRWKAQNA